MIHCGMRILPLASMILMGSVTAQAGEANVLINQQPTRVGGAYSDTEFVTMFGQQIWQERADSFQLPTSAAVSAIAAWGFYDLDNPPAVETMRIRFYSARPGDGFPGSILREEVFTSFSRIATGEIVLVGVGPREFRYTFTLASPLALNAGATYWMELAQIDDPVSAFLWEWSDDGDHKHAYINPFVIDWTQSNGSDQAFQLIGVPEPASVCLLGLVFAVASRRRSAGSRY